MGRITLVILVGLGFACPASADGIADMLKCKRMPEPLSETLEVCSAALNSGDLKESDIGDTLFYRGVVHYRLGDLIGALNDLNLSIDYNPEVALAYYYKGLTFEAQGEEKRADSQYKNAYFYDPENAEIGAKMAERALLN